MRTWIVSRHPAAVAWLVGQGFAGRVVPQLGVAEVRRGDLVVGTLPAHVAAGICASGASYRHLSLDIPLAMRGRELDLDALLACKPRLETLEVRHASAHAL